MLAEFRWILLGLGLLLIAGIWWWGARRSAHAQTRAELREPSVGTFDSPGAEAAGPTAPSGPSAPSGPTEPSGATASSGPRDYGVPPFEPLNIRTAEFEQVPVMDLPVMSGEELVEAHAANGGVDGGDREAAGEPVRGQEPPPTAAAPLDAASVPRAQTSAPPAQRIVSIRVCAAAEQRWAGSALLQAFEQQGLTHGRYQVFHRRHSDGRTLFCAASLVEPGTFDVSKMPDESYRGLTLFAVLPGPCEPANTLDALLATGRYLAQSLHGELQDAKGQALTAQHVDALREDVAHLASREP